MTVSHVDKGPKGAREMDGRDMAEFLGDWVNSHGRHAFEEFATHLTIGVHRTLQQICFGLFVRCLKQWKRNAGSTAHSDARNDFACEGSKKLMCGTAPYEESQYFDNPPCI